MRNNKGKAAGSGTVSNKRREAFKQKGLERENMHMSKIYLPLPKGDSSCDFLPEKPGSRWTVGALVDPVDVTGLTWLDQIRCGELA